MKKNVETFIIQIEYYMSIIKSLSCTNIKKKYFRKKKFNHWFRKFSNACLAMDAKIHCQCYIYLNIFAPTFFLFFFTHTG